MFPALGMLYGLLVGFALGLTGGGGSILAVPLLVYGLAIAPREAVGVSLAAVGATALVGSLGRFRAAEVDLGAGLLFALTGMLGAPLGTWINGYVPDWLLLVLLAGLLLIVAARMWGSSARTRASRPSRDKEEAVPSGASSARRVGETPRGLQVLRGLLLGLAGWITGVLSGAFGVGGGFLIVPALVLVGGLEMHRATATSLFVIALISAAGVVAYLSAGRSLALDVTASFVVGGLVGMRLGVQLGRRLSGPHLQRICAAALVAVAVVVVGKSIV